LAAVGVAVLVVAGACSDDPSTPAAEAGAGTSADAGHAGAADVPEPNAGGTAAGNAAAGNAAAGSDAGEMSGGNAGEGAGGARPVEDSPDVKGQVRAGKLASANVVVAVNGVVAITDAEGRFEVEDVASVYQLMLRYPGEKVAYVYNGVKTRAPSINTTTHSEFPIRSATIRGKLLQGFGDPEPDDAHKTVAYVGTSPGYCAEDFYLPNDTFEITPQWLGPADDNGEIWALQMLRGFDVGTYEYTGFGRKTISLTDLAELGSADGSPLTDVSLEDPDDVPVEAHRSAPTDWTVDSAHLYLGPLEAPLEIPLGDSSVVLPAVDVPLRITASAYGEEGWSELVAVPNMQADLTFVHSLPPLLASPDANATGVTADTEFFWENMPKDSVATVTFRVGDWTIVCSTASGSAKFPDLSPLHVRVPGPIAGSWSVAASGPATTIEEAMALQTDRNTSAARASFTATSNERDFATGE